MFILYVMENDLFLEMFLAGFFLLLHLFACGILFKIIFWEVNIFLPTYFLMFHWKDILAV